MACSCKVGRQGKAEQVDALLAAGHSLDSIAAQTGIHRSAVHRHSQRCRDAGNAPGSTAAADRQLLKHWNDLHKKSVKAANWDAAARALNAIAEIQARLAPPPKASRPSETRWTIRYEDGSPFGEKEENSAARAENLPRSAQRADLITRIAVYFGVERESAERLVSEIEKAKPEDWGQEANDVQNQKLLVEEAEGSGDEGNGQARGDRHA